MCWGAVLQSGDVAKDGDATMSQQNKRCGLVLPKKKSVKHVDN